MSAQFEKLQSELRTELDRIIEYWTSDTLDHEHGGFLGKRDHVNKLVPKSNKGIILNSRILWSFAAASNHSDRFELDTVMQRSYEYLNQYFRDQEFGGVYWEVDYLGNAVNHRKKIYAQAFMIYALSEYYKTCQKEEAKDWAIDIFNLIEKYARDTKNLGYLEAFDQNWDSIEDVRLSEKDMNATKTMNTHLHVLEAYTTLHQIYPNQLVKEALRELIQLFNHTFLNANFHYNLFFDADWNLLSNIISYGHDIEAAWLILEAAKELGEEQTIQECRSILLQVADQSIAEGIDNSEYAVVNEKNLTTGLVDTDRHWWPQMEAIIGLTYAYDLSKDEAYIDTAAKIWEYTKSNLLDFTHGEWHFRVNVEGKAYEQEDKVSMWKAPYHTSRACIKLNEHSKEFA